MCMCKNGFGSIIFILSIIFLPSKAFCLFSTSAVTYVDTPGRLGDKLFVYSKAKKISYQHNIPLLYVPLRQFDQFMMHNTDVRYTKSMNRDFRRIVHLKRGDKNFVIEPDKGILYVVNYYSEIAIDWNDRGFLETLRARKQITFIY